MGRQVDNCDRNARRAEHQNRRKHPRQRARGKRDYFTFDSGITFFFWEKARGVMVYRSICPLENKKNI